MMTEKFTMAANDEILLSDNLRALGITPEPEAIENLLRYLELLRLWNGRINLVSRKDIVNLIPNHIIDSLTALPLIAGFANKGSGTGSGLRLMDLGPGGGFPGIPLKICLPEIDLKLVEATQKKAKFLELVILELGLNDTAVIPKHSRELVKDSSHLNKYDVVTARAVSELKELVKDSFPLLAPGGRLLAYKSGKADAEIAASREILKKLGGEIETGVAATTTAGGKDRRIVAVRKMN